MDILEVKAPSEILPQKVDLSALEQIIDGVTITAVEARCYESTDVDFETNIQDMVPECEITEDSKGFIFVYAEGEDGKDYHILIDVEFSNETKRQFQYFLMVRNLKK